MSEKISSAMGKTDISPALKNIILFNQNVWIWFVFLHENICLPHPTIKQIFMNILAKSISNFIMKMYVVDIH